MGSFVTIGANVQFNNDADPPNITITPKNDLSGDTVYAISYPSGAFTQSGAGGSFVGTAYTFATEKNPYGQLWMMGDNQYGILGQNDVAHRSSPVQIPGNNWKELSTGGGDNAYQATAIKNDGTLWAWGYNSRGQVGQNNRTQYSSPVQIPGTTWKYIAGRFGNIATKTDGTLWAWGDNNTGHLGQNDQVDYSSPVQIPGTTWSTSTRYKLSHGALAAYAIKTDNTLWAWGYDTHGGLANNDRTHRSSPVQIPGTTWQAVSSFTYGSIATKTDGTLWAWGLNQYGQLAQGDTTSRSSPVQVPGTTWGPLNASVSRYGVAAIKTDGTLWQWGANTEGGIGDNTGDNYSSPKQIPGTTWNQIAIGDDGTRIATKTDGTLWAWGRGNKGQLAQNNETSYSSPVQIPGTGWILSSARRLANMAIKQL